jgi:hypothetical protein
MKTLLNIGHQSSSYMTSLAFDSATRVKFIDQYNIERDTETNVNDDQNVISTRSLFSELYSM